MMYTKQTILERFYDKVVVENQTGCWQWFSTLTGDGYGVMVIKGKHKHAHRLSWELLKGEIPVGLWVCHLCSSKSCVNPDHLVLRTPTESREVVTRRGHSKGAVGALNGKAKLTWAQVRFIRRVYIADVEMTQQVLANVFSVTVTTINLITSYKIWKEEAVV